jgi:hypothetical protein
MTPPVDGESSSPERATAHADDDPPRGAERAAARADHRLEGHHEAGVIR